MRRSGFDEILLDQRAETVDMLYAGYSAGIFVLEKNLYGIHIIDNLTPTVYGDLRADTKGLGILDYLIVPHVDSDHRETELAAKCVEFMEIHKLPYCPLPDGETIILHH